MSIIRLSIIRCSFSAYNNDVYYLKDFFLILVYWEGGKESLGLDVFVMLLYSLFFLLNVINI